MSVLTEHKGPKSLLSAGHSFASVGVRWELGLLALVQCRTEEMGWINSFLSKILQFPVFFLREKALYRTFIYFYLVMQILNVCSARHTDSI